MSPPQPLESAADQPVESATDEPGSPEATPARRVGAAFEPLRRRVGARLEVDTRALAALRVALGLILLLDLLHRAGHASLFYTDEGVHPVSLYETTYSQFTGYSLHAMSGELWFQLLLFAVGGLFALALVVGYRTRLVAAVSLVLLFSLHARNPAVLNGGDRLLRVLLFVAVLTPMGERWSVDALRRGSARRTVVGATTTALLVQPVAVFTTNAIVKHRGDTWFAGEALQIALANDEMTVLLGNYLLAFPGLLTVLTWAWVVLLGGSAAFLLLTAGRLRALVALAYVGAFAGMALTLAVGFFPLVLAASVLPFLTTPFWEAAGRRLPTDLSEWLPRPTADRLGPLGRPPVERRLLGALRDRGHGTVASLLVGYARAFRDVVGALLVVWILLFCAAYLGYVEVPESVDDPVLDQQRWGLYAPDPSSSYNWYVHEAELENGSTVAALERGTVETDRPPDAALEHETFRHRKYMEAVGRSGGDPVGSIAERYAGWTCGRAEAIYDGRVTSVTVSRFVQPSPVDGTYEEPRRYTLVEREC